MVGEVARRRECLAGHDEGMLKTYLDGQLPEAWRESTATHVAGCPACTDRLARLRLDGAVVQGQLQASAPVGPGATGVGAGLPPRPPVGVVLARARRPDGWRERAAAWWGDYAPVGQLWSASRAPWGKPAGDPSRWGLGLGAPGAAWRPLPLAAGAAAGVALLLGVATTQPAVQAVAQAALQQFRVQRVQPVQVDLTALRNLPPIDHSVVEAFFRSGTYSGPKDTKVRAVKVAEANRATGLRLRGLGTLPSQVKGNPQVLLSDPVSFTFTYDAQKLAQVAQEVGVKDTAVLAQLQAVNGLTVKGDVPAAAAVLYGNPFPEGPPASAGASAGRIAKATPGAPDKAMGPAMVFLQLKSPAVEMPKDVNVDQLREQVLKAGVESGTVPPALAAQLLMIDWKTTLPIPVTKGKATQVQVDGVTGTLVTGEGPGPVLIWQKDGAVYLLGGVQVSEADVLAASRSLTVLDSSK